MNNMNDNYNIINYDVAQHYFYVRYDHGTTECRQPVRRENGLVKMAAVLAVYVNVTEFIIVL